jgi:hypothetical protein
VRITSKTATTVECSCCSSKTSTTVAANLARYIGNFSHGNNWFFLVYLRKKYSPGRGGDESRASISERGEVGRGGFAARPGLSQSIILNEVKQYV